MNWIDLAALAVVALLILGLHLVRRRIGFTARTLLAIPLGVAVGVAFQGHVEYVEPIGSIYVNGLMALVGPLIIVSILSSVTGFGTAGTLRRVGLRSVGWLVLTTGIAIVLTLGVALSLGVGRGAEPRRGQRRRHRVAQPHRAAGAGRGGRLLPEEHRR